MCWMLRGTLLGLFVSVATSIGATEAPTNLPISLTEAPQRVVLPPGFKISLFAGEPDVLQPIAMAFDDRGRLWVAECFTYSDSKTNFDANLRDRIVIFEDSKGTGHFDKRKVFWDQGQRLTSIALGFGGVFATCAPNLIFIPDRDGDDRPDGPPEILLDGWDAGVIRHNVVNGFTWGPDGWLYGRHGIQATSNVAKPGTPADERTKFNCAIWRYHPTRKLFEVVCHGTTNPWGHDWDQYGELFFINTVIGHLWAGIPGAHFKRMYGEHLAPYRYALLDQAADHYHWDTGKTWTESRNAAAGADALGGGHAHSGLMIYQGDSWPEAYRNRLFTLNFHGRRINQERLEPSGSATIGKHEPDFVKFQDPWFRGIDLDYGPDGEVYILDWSDTGECHENDADGVHRETGRIYKLSYVAHTGRTERREVTLPTNSLAVRSNSELVRMQSHPNAWFAGHARRILQERAFAGKIEPGLERQIQQSYEVETNVPRKLRFMFALHAIGVQSAPWLQAQLREPDEHVRAWAVRLLAEPGADWQQLIPLYTRLAAEDPSPRVRLYLASMLQRAPVEMREPVAAALLRHAEDSADRYLPLMEWYAIEPIASRLPTNAVRLAQQSQQPLVREYIARRIAEDLATRPAPVDLLLQIVSKSPAPAQLDILRGLTGALRGWRKAPKPPAWDSVRSALVGTRNQELLNLARELGVIFGDPWAEEELREIAAQIAANPENRQAALRQLIEARPVGLRSFLETLLLDPATAGVAARGLLLFDDPAIPALVLKQWSHLTPEDRVAVVGSMAARASSAAVLLESIARGELPRSALTAFHARQIRNFNDDALTRKLAAVWGEVRTSDAEKTKLMTQFRALLTPPRLKQANLSRGREVFNQVCAVCHKLYGQGINIGPDLTGGGRGNLDYLLENIVDPNALVAADYRVSEVELKDDRVLSALIPAKTDRTVTLQTPTERTIVDRSDIVKIRQTALSLMPEGLLQGLTEEQIVNLIAYLMNPSQVPLPTN